VVAKEGGVDYAVVPGEALRVAAAGAGGRGRAGTVRWELTGSGRGPAARTRTGR
jgi:hypothetical protein